MPMGKAGQSRCSPRCQGPKVEEAWLTYARGGASEVQHQRQRNDPEGFCDQERFHRHKSVNDKECVRDACERLRPCQSDKNRFLDQLDSFAHLNRRSRQFECRQQLHPTRTV